jgi:hypothetical protein
MSGTPSPNGHNGRAINGQFAAGNAGGPGNPRNRQTAALRALLLDAVTFDDLRAVVAKLVEMAKAGDLAAIRELLDRTLGKSIADVNVDIEPPQTIRIIERIVSATGEGK